MRNLLLTVIVFLVGVASAQDHPFGQKIELYSDEDGQIAFALRLEQPFLADQFEKTSFLNLHPLDNNARLIYPKETQFIQKHADFYGRLKKGGESAELMLSWEVITENIDGSQNVEKRESRISVDIPTDEVRNEGVFLDWARAQTAWFNELLKYYPDDSFLQYIILQSAERYEISIPDLSHLYSDRVPMDLQLYTNFSGSSSVSKQLQFRQIRHRYAPQQDLNLHISALTAPSRPEGNFDGFIEQMKEEDVEPTRVEMARVIPSDQYLLLIQDSAAAKGLLNLSTTWAGDLRRVLLASAKDHKLEQKLESQFGVLRESLVDLFESGAIDSIGVTGSDFFLF